jgi:hypothetical protein
MDQEPREDEVSGDGEDSEDSESSRARALIYVVAAGFIVVGGMSVAAYWLKCRHEHLPIGIGHCLYSSIPLVIGVVILIMSSALARAIEEYLDE